MYKRQGYSGIGTDDHVAILACWAQCALGAGGGVSYVGTGQYLSSVSLSLPSNVCLQGNGFSSLIWQNAVNGVSRNGSGGVAGYIADMTFQNVSLGLCGLNIQNVQGARVDRCVSSGWTQQGVTFIDTILSEMSLTVVSACGSLSGGVRGGTGYAAVEVDSAIGAGSTTWNWYNNNVTNNNGPSGLRIDRTGAAVISGGGA